MSPRLTAVVSAVLWFVLTNPTGAAAQAHFEFGFHYGKWSVNLLKSTVENMVDDYVEEIKNKQVDQILKLYPFLRETNFVKQVEFDSSGNNIGFEFRWYPGGEKGSFSIGVAGEQTSMRIGLPTLSTAITLQDSLMGATYTFNGDGDAEVETKPFALMATLRWDILPSGRVSPYISIGAGAAGGGALDKTKLGWSYSGTLSAPGIGSVTIADANEQTLGQLKIEEDFTYPVNFFPFLQLNAGLKVKATKSIHFLLDAGVLDGFLLRGGIAFRL